MIILSWQDQEVFLEVHINQPNPSVKLRAVAQHYKQKLIVEAGPS